jgi:predicted permease
MNSIFRKLSWLIRRRTKEDELREEIQFHLEEETEERREDGLSPQEAERAARLDFGNSTLLREETREAWTWTILEQFIQDLRYAARAIVANKTFSVAAILSLALGVGANTAIFGIWNGVLHAWLPVFEPDKLVMLSNPDASGMWTGRWVGREDGDRAWLTYGEFEQLRDQSQTFAGLMASQSYLDEWQVRFEGSEPEQVRGRLVSGGFFEVLGTTAALGRTFTPANDRADSPYVVISHNYWQRRFSGRQDVIGKTLRLRNAALTVIGVTPKGFIGETIGQQPDMWIPLRMQPAVIPGEDRLRDTPPFKAMWLHVFGRLKPGITRTQAEAEANTIFQRGLESFYGDRLGERRAEFLDQHLGIHDAARGVSDLRKGISDSLTILLVSVGVLIFITSANLASLFLARGAARKSEIALRLSLGASRSRLVRQLITESLVLAIAGTVAGLAVAQVFHGGLVRMLGAWNSDFQMNFTLGPHVLIFTFAVAFFAWMLFGVLPAWQVTRLDPGENLNMQSRTATASIAQIRWRQLLVCSQLALCLPLLISAGLLGKTLYNLQRVDLGFPAEKLLIVPIDTTGLGYDSDRLGRLANDLRDQFQRTPGVKSASFSINGVFSGGTSHVEIDVEGYTPKAEEDRGSTVDVVGAGYFSTLGVPIVAGREILPIDQTGPGHCVINEAFAKTFFEARSPIGSQITTKEGDTRWSCQIVGVAKNARTENLRGDITAHYFVPVRQVASPRHYIFLVRTVADSAPVLTTLLQLIRRADSGLSVESAQTIEEQLAPLTARDRTTTQLVSVFGCVALIVAAVGLYGVLAYNVVRRKSEIAIRIALGARQNGIVGLLLRETMRIVFLGLVIGLGLACIGLRLIQTQLFGVAPQDPIIVGSALGMFLLVALSAAYIPARRASRLDPIVALRGE